jgi:hypothetical protein
MSWSNDDETQVNSNIKGYMEQLHAMLESDEFPELDYSETVTNGSAQGFAVADASTSKTSGEHSEYSRRKQEKKKPRTNQQSKGRQSQKGQRNNIRSTRAVQGGSESSSISQKSWSEVVSDKQRAVTAPDTQQRPSNTTNAKGNNDMDELKSMIQTLLTNSEIARKEANAQARQVQRWSKTCRSLASQVLELHKVVETLLQASSYSGSTMLSVTASLERVRQAQKDCPIPMEVILDQQLGGNTTTATSLESITLETCDGRDREMDRVTKLVQGTKSDTKEITLDKPEEDSLNDMNTFKSMVEGESGTDIQAEGSTIALQDDEMESAEIEGNGDGFHTPTRKHGASATSVAKAATAMEGIIEKDNPYVALMPLKPSRNHGSSTAKSPSGSSPRKKKPKVSPKFMKQMEAQLEKQQEEESAINDDDIAISLLE